MESVVRTAPAVCHTIGAVLENSHDSYFSDFINQNLISFERERESLDMFFVLSLVTFFITRSINPIKVVLYN